MPYRRYPFGSIWKEFDEMMNEMEQRFNEILQGFPSERLLPAPCFRQRMIPALRGEFSVDVREHEDEVIVVADLPGVDKEDITVTLIDPRTVEIASNRQREQEESAEGFYVQERLYGSMRRQVLLPADVTDRDSRATFTNGVLELRFKKQAAPGGKTISIE